MPLRARALWALAVLVSLACLIAPAVWNGFALLQYDTGGYLARWYEGTLEPSRAVVYGLILVAGAPLDFWPVVIVQSALTIWVIALTLREHGLGRRPLVLLGVIAALSVITTLPWLTSILLTDIFAGLSVLALYLLLLHAETLTRAERIGLIALTAIGAATHSGTLAVLLAMLAAAACVFLFDAKRMPARALGRGAGALALSAVLVLGGEFFVAKRLAWTPGGPALSFGRMLQDGIVKRYLDDHCPDPALRLCAYKDELPEDADDFFWGEGLFDRLGRFEGLNDEMRRIALASLIDYPLLQIKSVVTETATQLVRVRTGAGVVNWIWNTYDTIEAHVPGAVPAMQAARQQRTGLSFDLINAFQVPIAWLAMALLPLIALGARHRPNLAGIGELACATGFAILANAAVFGTLATAHNRYGAHMVWLAVFVVLLAFARLMQDREQTALGGQKI